MKYVYLHGFASSPASTKARFFAQRFAEAGLHLEVPDLAPDGFERLTISRQIEVVNAAGPGEVTLIGSSMGGYVAALCASRNPLVKRAVLLAPAFALSRGWPDIVGAEAVEEWQRTGKLAFHHYGDDCQRELGYQLITDGAQYPDYPDVRQPVLILHGRKDTVVPLSGSEDFVRNHPNAELVEFDAGHELTEVLEGLWTETVRFLELLLVSGSYRIS